MKKKLLLSLLSCCFLRLSAQNFEFLAGHRNLTYQHAFTKNASNASRFALTHIASVLVPVRQTERGRKLGAELMNQGYLKFRIYKSLSLNAGGFYANSSGLKPSVAISYMVTRPHFLMIIQPRTDVVRSPSIELFGLFEWRPVLTKHLLLYTRFQFMSNSGTCFHNRSYQQLRIGFEVRALQFGMGFQADEYGRSFSTRYNSGFFIRRQF
jgi:hypothetical protein